jgi:beta-lactamase class A
MMRRHAAIVAAVLLVVPAVSQAATSTASHDAKQAVEAEIGRISATVGGEVGVRAVHLESGAVISLNDTDFFPMASTFKIAVAGAVLAQVDAGRISLDQLIPVDPALTVPSEGIAEIFPFPGVSVSVHNLIDTMLVRSDNTAANVLTRLAGGPAAVTAWVRRVGVGNMRVDGDTKDIVTRFFGPAIPAGMSLEAALAADPKLVEMSTRPSPQFDDDPRDTATPQSMTALLSRIAQNHPLSVSSTQLLLDTLKRVTTGRNRLRALLPPGTVVAEKTGTIGGTVNDAGVIELPGARGRIVIAVFIKQSASDQRERVIAQIGRCVYDYMLMEGSR